jgi:hypothetical protein
MASAPHPFECRNMLMTSHAVRIACCLLLWTACGDDEIEADRLGVGAECRRDDDCLSGSNDSGPRQSCLLQFKGGYCGLEDCAAHGDCPEGSACVVHDDGNRYCFRSCANKAECNVNRSPEQEANCSSSVEYIDGSSALGKACVPPSGN